MPQLGTSKSVRVFLPSTANLPDEEQVWVEIRAVPSIGDVEDVDFATTNRIKPGIEMISKMLADWNFSDEQDAKMPLTKASIRLLPIPDYKKLDETVGAILNADSLSQDDRKKSIPTSASEGTGTGSTEQSR